MAFKFVVLAAFVAAANAGLIGAPLGAAPLAYSAGLAHAPLAYSAPVARVASVAAPLAVAKAVVPEPYDPHPQYNYGYSVQDGLTGDSKSHQEVRDGDVVQGSYSLVDPDGTRRTVEYTADPINGFNAVVHREPLVAKTVVAAPAVAKVATPVLRSAIASPYASPILGASPLLRAASPITRVW